MTTPEHESRRILIHAPIGRDGPASAELLERAGLAAQVCPSLDELMEGLDRGAAAVFIAEEGLFGRDLSGLFAWVERQPPWSDLPFVVLTSRQEQPAVGAWRKRLVTSLRNVSLLERPVQAITLTSTMQATIRARRRQYEVRTLIEKREKVAQELEALVRARTSELEEANRALRTQISERARIEESLRQAQKIEAIGQLTGGVAHDFNNLLTIIRSSTDLLRRPGLPEDRRRRYVDAIADTVDRAAKLTGQLLAFARRQALKPVVFDVAERVRTIADMLRIMVGARIRILTEFACDHCFAEADVSQFETALVNMVVNARDAMDGEGTLMVKVESLCQMPAIRGHTGSPGAFVAVSLADTGTGIPADRLSEIFEPFFTTKEIGKGTGLGLSQVYGFAKQSGGDIAVESELGRGTTFTLYLPRVEPVPDEAPLAREPAQDHAGGGRRVLIVEDNVAVGTFSTQILEDLGYETTWAANGDEALVRLSEGKFDVVFSDVVMPGMSGVELGQEIRRRHPDVPVVLTSGYSHVLAAEGRHGFELLQKPYAAEELSRILRRAKTR